MVTIERFNVTNKGNSEAHFNWIFTPNKIFTVSPEDYVIKSGETKEVILTYTPSRPQGIIYPNQPG